MIHTILLILAAGAFAIDAYKRQSIVSLGLVLLTLGILL